jgi:hypothetical protein
MTGYEQDLTLAGLKDFQRATVDHVAHRFYHDDPTRRFLVADETGLGKSIVARGLIIRAVERLQSDDSVERIDIVYVCSNIDIANQNLARLNITADKEVALTSRLTLLAKHSHQLKRSGTSGDKPINLIAFTPGTSFDKGWSTGKAEERAMLFLLLERHLQLTGWDRRAALRALQATTGTRERFEYVVDKLRCELGDQPDPIIANEFITLATNGGLSTRFVELISDIGRREALPAELNQRAKKLIGELRTALAKAGISTLEPDLIILDEFQRFRHLLSVEEGGESAELAHHLFNHEQARVLLLSATPYKPYTLAEERADGEDHHRDLLQLLWFLRDDAEWHAQVTRHLQAYRDAVISGCSTAAHAQAVRELLLTVMCRTERPTLGHDDMLSEHTSFARIEADDLLGYHALRQLASELNSPATVEYWKSAPYFVNFMEGYALGNALREALKDPAERKRLAPLIKRTQRLSPDDVRRFAPIDFGNGRLRVLAAQTVGAGWWNLLWVPPSMPYYAPQGPFAEPFAQDVTKRLVFSSWNATPTAVAALLSYDAERHLLADALRENTAETRHRVATRLEYRVDASRPAAMSTLALFWPHPQLAQLADPLTLARATPEKVAKLSSLQATLRATLTKQLPAGLHNKQHAGESTPWSALLQWPGGLPPVFANDRHSLVNALSGSADDHTDSDGMKGLTAHVDLALGTMGAEPAPAAKTAAKLISDLVALGMHGPGNIAWRALDRLLGETHHVTEGGHWVAAATLASGLRALFNRMETTALLDQLYPDQVYWRAVLDYNAAGCLQAALDEYVHHLRSNQATNKPLNDHSLLTLAHEVSQAMVLRPSTYQAFDPERPEQRMGFTSRFALRYGAGPRDQDSPRPTEVRNAFNSPFWPFVLTTTSAGQEGIDFHWWSHAVVHWNTPSNPVDFEQREGRVHRFGGHAIRRNIAAHHRTEVLASSERDPWQSAYRIAHDASRNHLGEFAPFWLYPGEAKVQRHLLPYPLSLDVPRTAQLKDDLALYRLAFGQPRQEDLIELLRRRGTTATTVTGVDLRPPRRPRNQ